MNIVIVVAVTVAVNCFHWQARLKVTRTRDQRSAAASAFAAFEGDQTSESFLYTAKLQPSPL